MLTVVGYFFCHSLILYLPNWLIDLYRFVSSSFANILSSFLIIFGCNVFLHFADILLTFVFYTCSICIHSDSLHRLVCATVCVCKSFCVLLLFQYTSFCTLCVSRIFLPTMQDNRRCKQTSYVRKPEAWHATSCQQCYVVNWALRQQQQQQRWS